ncbi:SRSO17 transposase [Actinopolyspora xinjiangensis]|uniref:SRSO17 transposase n=1 Tax=Actinopolyspora xinjiangensis TaxID=405564 RepID=A0A1H0RH59_9ACTN|nr:transposase [Actinopolyspora xinjiangensis]SDP28356.1 SRSO17 transposase [Actinopolyspora xinjiangensis]
MNEYRWSVPSEDEQHHEVGELAQWLFQEFPRVDQRRWAEAYLRGLLTTPGKKSVRRMGETVSTSETAWQSLHQVVNASTWRWEPVREHLADWWLRRRSARALVLAPVSIPKRGRQSVGVHRRFDPSNGRTLGCQWAMSLYLSTGEDAVPVDWRIQLPDRWSEDVRLRERACVPSTAGSRSPHEMALDLLASQQRRISSTLPVLAEATTTEVRSFVTGLAACGRYFALSVPSRTPLTVSRWPLAYRARAKQEAETVSARRLVTVATEPLSSGSATWPRIVPADVRVPGCRPELRLVSSSPPGGGPQRLWLTNMDHPRLAATAEFDTVRDTVDRCVEVMRECGLHDFEGRSFPGWHRHMSLVSAAATHRVLREGSFPVEPTGVARKAS